MLQTQGFLSSPVMGAAQFDLPQPSILLVRPRRLRHYLVGSPEDTQYAIDRLHLLGYLERLNWSRVIEIPDNGLIIRPDLGDVLRYCQRDWPSA
jgi:hypothetical protein